MAGRFSYIFLEKIEKSIFRFFDKNEEKKGDYSFFKKNNFKMTQKPL